MFYSIFFTGGLRPDATRVVVFAAWVCYARTTAFLSHF